MKKMTVRLTFTEGVLGTASANKSIHSDYIASKAPDAMTRSEEVAAIGTEAAIEQGMTVFPRNADGEPIFWDYQIRGFFKGSCGFLRPVPDTLSSKVKAYKKKIDGNIFIDDRQIIIHIPEGEDIEDCERPLRAETAQGPRVALAHSEEVPAGSWIEFTVTCLIDSDTKLVEEWLNFGQYNGIGQWRNSGKGRFTWEEV